MKALDVTANQMYLSNLSSNDMKLFIVHKAFIYQIYFIDFLERCADYAITDLVSAEKL